MMMLLSLLVATHVYAQTLITEKKSFELKTYQTVMGQTIAPVRVGYETYGTLNEEKSNAILITHFFSGNSHAAGKYAETDPAAGYWDSIIGPGKAIDTNKYFVISSDTLVNIAPKNPMVITTGPASINPKTKKPYGMSFPLVSVEDFVHVQQALISSLGIKKLHAVIGSSGGAAQALQWAASYPAQVGSVISVIGPGLSMPPYVIAMLDMWSMPIRMDKNWRNGNYSTKNEPVDGVKESLKFIIFSAVHFDWAEKGFGGGFADPNKHPLAKMENKFAVEAGLEKAGLARGALVDANSLLYTAKAIQSYNIQDRAKAIVAPILFIPADTDMIFPPEISQKAMQTLCEMGKHTESFLITGRGGHLDGLFAIAKAQDPIKNFLQGKRSSKCGQQLK